MEILNDLALGVDVAVSATNLIYCFLGVFLGTLVGVLPGLGPMASISMLLPLVYNINDPVTAIIFLAGIYYGTQYGGSTTSILLKLPGEITSVVTVIDGYKMTQQGRAGPALAIAALSSFIAGTIATVIVAILGKPLASVAFMFGPADYVGLMVLGLVSSIVLIRGDLLKGLAMVLLGTLLGLVGMDINSGVTRYVFNIPDLVDGISFAIIAMGVFGLAELLYNYLHESTYTGVPEIKNLYPNKTELKQSIGPSLRGTLIGSLLGLLPGGAAIISSFVSYIVEKKWSKTPQKFGQGAVEGIAGPEAANNASAQTSFIPMLSIGIPTTPVMALMVATLMIYNIVPGPQVIDQNPNLFWGFVVSMWIGNLFLVILNLPLIRIWVAFLKLPQKLLYLAVLAICVVGTYYINYNWTEVAFLIPAVVLGYLFKVVGCDPTPLAMGFVVGPMIEDYMRKALTIAHGNWGVFVERPWALTFLTLSLLLAVGMIWRQSRSYK